MEIYICLYGVPSRSASRIGQTKLRDGYLRLQSYNHKTLQKLKSYSINLTT